MEPYATEYAQPTNVPARALRRLIDRLIELARSVEENPRYASLHANFGSTMLEHTLRDLKDRPYPYRDESHYWQEAQRRFWYITRRNARWQAGDRARAKEQLLDESGWQMEENRCHRVGSASERRQTEHEPLRHLLEEVAPSHSQLLAALHAVGIRGKQAEAWVLFRWEEAESFRALGQELRKRTGAVVPEATLRKWEERLYRDPEKMARFYTQLTGEPPTPDMIARLLRQKRYSPARHSIRPAETAATQHARQDNSPAGVPLLVSCEPTYIWPQIVLSHRTTSHFRSLNHKIGSHKATIAATARNIIALLFVYYFKDIPAAGSTNAGSVSVRHFHNFILQISHTHPCGADIPLYPASLNVRRHVTRL